MHGQQAPITGLIDIHSHLLPGIDDGCIDLQDSLECIAVLKRIGYVGSICTPHLWPQAFPANTPAHIHGFVAALRRELAANNVEYPIWAGGELRLFKDVVDWMKAQGVPTLADSRCVLVDLWDAKWPKFADYAFDWLLEQGYQPILAHPERMKVRNLDQLLRNLEARGVWLQGNFRPMTGEDGYHADQMVRKLLSEGRYRFMALDLHRFADLYSRIDGMVLVEQEFGVDAVQQLTVDAPLRDIFRTAELPTPTP